MPPALARPVRAVARRIRLQRALDSATLFGLAALGLSAGVLAAHRVDAIAVEPTRLWLAIAAALPVLGAALGALRPVPPLVPAQLLDRAHALRSRIANALEFGRMDPEARTGFIEAAVREASAHADRLRPARAMPLRWPPGLPGLLGLGAGVALLAALTPPPPPEPPESSRRLAPLLLHPDELDAFESGLDEAMVRRTEDPELDQAARRYNQLLEDLADRRLDRSEALRRIAELERQLTSGREASAESLREDLERLGERMKRSGLIEEASEALRDADANRAEKEMRELADKLREDQPSRQELAQLRRDLEQASREQEREKERKQQRKEELEQELEQQRQELERLLQKQREEQEQTPQQKRLLEKKKRELERLRREQQQMQEQQRRLERLRRELERAAEELNRGQQEQAGQSLEQGAEDLNRMARQQMSEEQRRQLERQLRQLREMIRRQRQNQGEKGQGQGQGQERMDRFVLRARGQGDGESMPLLMPGEGQGDGQGGRGSRQKGQGQGQGDGKEGEKGLMLGGSKGGGSEATLEMPGMGGEQQGDGQGQGRGQRGPGAGTGHDPRMREDPTDMEAQHDDSHVKGQQSDEGPSRSESILSAADRGFVTRGYEKTYSEYQNHAEEVLEQDEVPPGYRFYVRRYFQLIRPREEQ